jgi:hypothetical protein
MALQFTVRLTEFALKTLGLCNLVKTHQGSVANVVQDGVQDGGLGMAMDR